jgi:dGTP triphosphohydrolase
LLAAYATQADASAGRVHPEPACPMRTPFQRDRDRIVHATAFRRLTYKTQVFVFHEGDHYRTRLTHSLEVAQIARAIARMLALDEDLAEALALAHDLGHPPFGHAGERALATAMAPFGGFDHNAQSLKVVTSLERKYADFDGLNLSLETLEGLAKHNGPLDGPMRPPRRRRLRSPTTSPTIATTWMTVCGPRSSTSMVSLTCRSPGPSLPRCCAPGSTPAGRSTRSIAVSSR